MSIAVNCREKTLGLYLLGQSWLLWVLYVFLKQESADVVLSFSRKASSSTHTSIYRCITTSVCFISITAPFLPKSSPEPSHPHTLTLDLEHERKADRTTHIIPHLCIRWILNPSMRCLPVTVGYSAKAREHKEACFRWNPETRCRLVPSRLGRETKTGQENLVWQEKRIVGSMSARGSEKWIWKSWEKFRYGERWLWLKLYSMNRRSGHENPPTE